MIDFRYHLVSIVAVFFALAVGIVLGAGPLNDDVNDVVAGQVGDLRQENQDLRDEITAQADGIEYAESFTAAVRPQLIDERLKRRSVLLVQLPGADQESIQQSEASLASSGARVPATLQIKASWGQPESDAVLETLAAQLVSAGVELPEDANGFERGAAVLANALMAERDAAQRDAVIDAYTEAGLISLSDSIDTPVELALPVVGPAPADGGSDDGDREIDAELALVEALGLAGQGAVVGGPLSATDDGGLLQRMRADGALTQIVSSVDVLPTSSGQVAIVLALEEQAEGGVGQYGAAPDVDGPVPTSVLKPAG